ncbi:unnamed protein product [Durusdinium trenchii]|uniref:Uncharacterized protein n=1 Tax=Durusdinium trenchii TaxID=1381693 RepID=A0ABP0R361_9DINO
MAIGRRPRLVTFEERELQEQLEELEERLQDTSERKPSSEGSVGHRRQSVTGEEELGLPTLEPARNALDESVFLASAAQAMAFTDFVQLTTGAAKIERKAVALGQTMAKLVEGQVIGKPEAQGKEWQAVCSDLVLDMEQVLDFIKVNGLPDGIIEKFWQEKQMEIRAAQQGALAATDAERRARRENAAKTRKLEGKLEKELQEQEMKKKQVLAAIEGVWARVDKGAPSKEPASPRGAAPRPTVAAPRPTMVAPRATVASSGPGAVMERILLQHRSDIEAGHKCRKELLQKIRDLEQKLSELVPDEHDAGVRGKPAAELMPGAPEAAEEAEEVVDWMGLNRHSATPDSKSASEPRSGRSTPGFPRQISDNARQSPGGDEKIEEEASSSSSSAEEPQALVMDPWILAFPFDEPALAKKKFDFCKANKIKPQKLHDMSRQKKYQFMLRRLMKQEKRTLALKQKLLLKFLTGDELQRAKAQMKKGPTDLEAESEADRQKLQDRETMISKLLTFWHRRMKTLEDDQESEREAFRLKVKALLEDIHALATVLENAALAEKRKQRINAEDLIRLRQQKAEEAARQQAEEERDRTKTYEALQAARSIEDKGSMSALQKMASFARRTSGSLEQPQEDDALERMRLAKMLRSYLSERQEQPGARTSSSQPGSPDSPGTPLSPGGTGRRASARNRGDERRRLSAEPRSPRALSQDEELQISATTFHTRSKTGGEVEEVPTKTLTTANLQMLDGEDPKTRRTSSIATGLMGGRRAKGTAKRKPSVAQRDSIFANPAAMSRRITGEAVSLATMSANTIEVTLAGVNAPEREKPAEAAKPKEAEPGVATSSSASAPGTSSAPVSQSWSFGQFPVVAPTPGVSKGKELKGKLKGRGSLSGLGGGANTLQMGVGTTPQGGTTPSRRQSHRPSRSASMAGPSTPGTPDLSPAQMMLTVSGKEEARRSLTLPGNLKRPDSARRRNAQSPSLQLQGSASQPGSRRGSAEGDEEEDVRAEMFLKTGVCSAEHRAVPGDCQVEAAETKRTLLELGVPGQELLGEDHCQWEYVTCEFLGCHVIELYCRHSCQGRLPKELKLKHLMEVDLCKSNVTGDLASFQHTPKLTRLFLDKSRMGGDLKDLEATPLLEALSLAQTRVGGDIAALAKLPAMQSVQLQNTQVEGDVKVFAAFGATSDLMEVNLASTKVHGNLTHFTGAEDLQRLDLSNTQVTGTLGPRTWLVKGEELQVLNLANTSITFEFDHKYSILPRLESLNVQSCDLRADVMHLLHSFSRSGSLQTIIASDASLSGELLALSGAVPISKSLLTLDLSGNNITRVWRIATWAEFGRTLTLLQRQQSPVRVSKYVLEAAVASQTVFDLTGTTLSHRQEAAGELFASGLLKSTTEFALRDEQGGFACKNLIAGSLRVTPSLFLPEELCRCLPGWYGHGAQCRPCPPNTWKDSVTNADTCHPCPANSTSLEGSSELRHCKCYFGELHNGSCSCNSQHGLQGDSCVPCSKLNLQCSQPGSILSTAVPERGFLRLAPGAEEARRCPAPAEVRCSGGHRCSEGYNGTLCTSCAEGFWASGPRCRTCADASSISLWILSLLAAVALLVALLVYYRSRLSGSERRRSVSARELLQKLILLQAPVLLQTVQLWSVLTRLATTETTEQRDGERLPEIPYLEALQLTASEMQNSLNLQCRWGDAAAVRAWAAMSSPLAPLLLLACCAAFELFRAGLGVNMALRTLTFLFIGGASSTSRLLSCQSVDGDGHSLGEWAFRSAVPTLRCSNGDGLGFWVDLVGYSSAVAYGLLIPLFLACLMLWQSFALQEARLIYAHATVEHEKSTLQLQTLQGRMSMDEVLPKRLLAAAAAHLSVHCRGEMLVNLEDEKVVLTSLGQPQGDFYEEEPMDPMKLVADQQTAKNLDRLRSKRLFEMLLERLMLAEARGSDRLLTGAQPLLWPSGGSEVEGTG